MRPSRRLTRSLASRKPNTNDAHSAGKQNAQLKRQNNSNNKPDDRCFKLRAQSKAAQSRLTMRLLLLGFHPSAAGRFLRQIGFLHQQETPATRARRSSCNLQAIQRSTCNDHLQLVGIQINLALNNDNNIQPYLNGFPET